MSIESIYSSYQPVQAYYDLLRAAYGEAPSVPLRLQGLDVYLLHRVATMHAPSPVIVDMTGDATLGALRYFWATGTAPIHALIGARARWQSAMPGWQRALESALDMAGTSRSGASQNVQYTAKTPDLVLDGRPISQLTDGLWPRLIVVTDLGSRGAEAKAHLAELIASDPGAIVAILPIGKTGESPSLEAIIGLLAEKSSYRALVAREVSPFFGQSQLAFMFPASSPQIPETMDRLAAMYDGNFSYAAILEQNFKLFQELQASRTQTVKLNPSGGTAAPAPVAAAAAPPTLKPLPPASTQRIRSAVIPIVRRLVGRGGGPVKANYVQASLPKEMKAGGSYDGTVQVQNSGATAWAASANASDGFSLSYHWATPDGEVLVKEGIRTLLPPRVEPGQILSVVMNIASPHAPGDYILELDIVQEGVTWFSDAGCPGPRFKVAVLA